MRDRWREEHRYAALGVVNVDVLERHDLELLERERVLRVVDMTQDLWTTMTHRRSNKRKERDDEWGVSELAP